MGAGRMGVATVTGMERRWRYGQCGDTFHQVATVVFVSQEHFHIPKFFNIINTRHFKEIPLEFCALGL